MNIIEKYFVTYKQALALKEIGFETSPIGGTNGGSVFYFENGKLHYDGITLYSPDYHDGQILAPLKSQVFEWFREKHQLFGDVHTDITTEPKFSYVQYELVGNPNNLTEKEWVWKCGTHSVLYRSYEQAESELIDSLIQYIKFEIGLL